MKYFEVTIKCEKGTLIYSSDKKTERGAYSEAKRKASEAFYGEDVTISVAAIEELNHTNLIVGKTYLIVTQREGDSRREFVVKITDKRDIWTHMNVFRGTAEAILPENERGAGHSMEMLTTHIISAAEVRV